MTSLKAGLKALAAAAALVLCTLPALAQADAPRTDPLPSWNEGATRQAIVDFVTRVTTEGGADFVPADQRLAVFDNDGTLWAEQPVYVQLFFAIDRIKELAPQHPEWQTTEPFASILKGDMKTALAGGTHAVAQIVGATHAGMTTDDFADIVAKWFADARNPVKDRKFSAMDYQPMLEVLAYLRANGFKTFIVSGGGIDFMRVFSQELYGIPPEQVIGSEGKLKFELKDGKPELVKLPDIAFVDDGPGKPVGIQMNIGREPIFAFGNSDGDLQMLQYTCLKPGPRFCGIVHHTDAAREWAYDRDSSIGHLDKALEAAQANDWTVVDMAADWKTVFPPEQ
ncbi:HAD family hydrolase [Ancylobacter mangrovi]|uniref:HAD family hydrolase n=1 Tax=Ancylobacter mangrovi TaxID=2972472 RepID=UPI0021633ED5|nr:HAD family hydrolase [Ancylobacter mangrovi]MCS0502666.1 haloacid dehalogenase-like hydrolase [Ancylobacter mangrovi]